MLLAKAVPPELAQAHAVRRLGVTITLADFATMPARLAADLDLIDEARAWHAKHRGSD